MNCMLKVIFFLLLNLNFGSAISAASPNSSSSVGCRLQTPTNVDEPFVEFTGLINQFLDLDDYDFSILQKILEIKNTYDFQLSRLEDGLKNKFIECLLANGLDDEDKRFVDEHLKVFDQDVFKNLILFLIPKSQKGGARNLLILIVDFLNANKNNILESLCISHEIKSNLLRLFPDKKYLSTQIAVPIMGSLWQGSDSDSSDVTPQSTPTKETKFATPKSSEKRKLGALNYSIEDDKGLLGSPNTKIKRALKQLDIRDRQYDAECLEDRIDEHLINSLVESKCCQESLKERLIAAKDELIEFQKKNECDDRLNLNIEHILCPNFIEKSPAPGGFHSDLIFQYPCPRCKNPFYATFKRFVIAKSFHTGLSVELLAGVNNKIGQKTLFPQTFGLKEIFEVIYRLFNDILQNKFLNLELNSMGVITYVKYLEEYGFPVSITIKCISNTKCGQSGYRVLSVYPVSEVPSEYCKLLKLDVRVAEHFKFNYESGAIEPGALSLSFISVINLEEILKRSIISEHMNIDDISLLTSIGINGFQGNTFLGWAVINQNVEVVNFLLNSCGLYKNLRKIGEDSVLGNQILECYSSQGDTPLMSVRKIIAKNGKNDNILAILKLLEDAIQPQA